jgi:predicted DNA-binding ribbon-helix-helix protein
MAVSVMRSHQGPSDARLCSRISSRLSRRRIFRGRNVAIEYRWAEGHNERLPALATDLVHVIAGHKTSVSLEDEFWGALKEIARGRHSTLSDIVGTINKERQHDNLSSAIRLFVLDFYRDQLPDRPPRLRMVA